MLFVHLAETAALRGSRSEAGAAPRPAAGATEERKGPTFVKAYSSGVCDGWPEGRKETLGPGARSARWETGRERKAKVARFKQLDLVYPGELGFAISPGTDRFIVLELLLFNIHWFMDGIQQRRNGVDDGESGHLRCARVNSATSCLFRTNQVGQDYFLLSINVNTVIEKE